MSSKVLKLIICLALILGGLVIKTISSDEKQFTVGILQTASHPALDQTRECFIAEMKKLMKGEVDFSIQNAEGSLSQAQSIAENFHSHQKIKAIFAIGTPAVQAAARIEKSKPIFIAAVSEPESLGLIYPGTNICGTTDRIDTESQADFIQQLIPHIESVAILYNPSESNSVSMVEKMEGSMKKRGIGNHVIGVHSESEIVQAVMTAARKGNVLLIPADNLLVGAMPLVAKEALKRKCPLIASDIPSVAKGALAAQGADYGDLGRQTAVIAHRVLLLGETPYQIGIHDPTNTKTIVNEKILAELKIAISKEIAASIEKGGPQ